MLPTLLFSTLQELTQNKSLSSLKKSAEDLSYTYRYATRDGKSLLLQEQSVLSYALTRMPATFEVINDVMQQIDFSDCVSLFDVGAGTGAGVWAAMNNLDLKSVVCFERDDDMRKMGTFLTKKIDSDVKWKPFDLVRDDFKETADIVLTSYVINELAISERLKAVEKLWNATKKFLIVIDNGTPDAFEMMKQIRTYLNEKGAFLSAPCPHNEECLNKWCHFNVRVARSKIHKELKSADVPFEDEKFTYLIFSKTPFKPSLSRIIRHPKIEKGKVSLNLCTPEGLMEKIVSKKDGELFKNARKSKIGDTF